MTRFRVATYNVHKCKGMDWKVSQERIASLIRGLRADLLTVQEVMEGQAKFISEQLEMTLVFGMSRKLNGKPYGNAIFSRFRVIDLENYDLTVKGYEPRQCVRVTADLELFGSVHFFGVHLGTSFAERRQQARRLASDAILDRPGIGGSRIVAGDFNEWTRGLATKLLSQHLKSADIPLHLNRIRTYPGLMPVMHLDHVYYDPVFRLAGMHLVQTREALWASDHLPLVADFETSQAVP